MTPIHPDNPIRAVYNPQEGISIRAEFAARIMQGLVTNPTMVDRGGAGVWIADEAVKMADALIARLNQPDGNTPYFSPVPSARPPS